MIPGASFVFEKEFGAASTLSTANGKAMNLLEKFVRNTGNIEKLKEIIDG